MLVAYSMSSTHVQTTLDYLQSLKLHTGYEVDYVHVTHDANVVVDFDQYDVVFHNYCSRLCFDGYVSQSYRNKLRAFKGVKILSVQDEYNRTNTLKEAIADLGFDIVLTCVPQDSVDRIYPRRDFPQTQFVTVFTGYVPEDFSRSSAECIPIGERPILIGYRGRDIGGLYGRLGFDKFEIGRRMKEICSARGLPVDIAMDEESRIYGEAWFDFIGNCRAMLGSESGSNVFDFDGSLEAKFKAMTKANGGHQPSYQDFEPFVAEREKEISMGQISPRVFECALMRTPMVLFRGRYSDAITPNEHYIALEKDFSNIDQVLNRLEDVPALGAMADRAYDHLVKSGKFGYRAFCQKLNALIAAELERKNVVRSKVLGTALPDITTRTARSRILSEGPTEAPGQLDELKAKLYCIAILNSSRPSQQTVQALFQTCRQYVESVRAHVGMLEDIGGVAPSILQNGLSREPLILEQILERCTIFEAEDLPRSDRFTQKTKNSAEMQNKRGQILEEAALFDVAIRNIAFFHPKLLDLHELVNDSVRLLRQKKGLLTSMRFDVRSVHALSKAPARAFASGVLRRFPKARTHINRLRRISNAA
ncbi:MAG: hypothetical protein ACTHPD_07490 [Rhizomicrobium sp.]